MKAHTTVKSNGKLVVVPTTDVATFTRVSTSNAYLNNGQVVTCGVFCPVVYR